MEEVYYYSFSLIVLASARCIYIDVQLLTEN